MFLIPLENLDAYFDSFLQSDLVKIYRAIPWDEFVTIFKIKESKNYFLTIGKPSKHRKQQLQMAKIITKEKSN